MSVKTTPQIDPIQSVQKTISLRIFPLVMIACAVIGFLGFSGIRSSARGMLESSHELILNDVVDQVNAYLNLGAGALEQLATEPHLSGPALYFRFAIRELADERSDVLGKMISLLRQHPDTFSAVRLLNASGTIVMGAVNSPDGATIPIRDQNASFQTDAAFRQAFEAGRNEIVFSQHPEIGLPDAAEGGMRFAIPINFSDDSDTILGVLQLDILVNSLKRRLDEVVQKHDAGSAGRAFLVFDAQGYLIYDNTSGRWSDRSGRSIETYLAGQPDPLKAVEVDNNLVSATYSVSYFSPDMPWRVVLVDDLASVLGPSYATSNIVFVLSLGIGLLVSLALNIYLRRTLIPVDQAAAMIQELVTGRSIEQMVRPSRTGDLQESVGHLANRLQALTDALESQRDQLKSSVETAARISRETATMNDLDELLNRIIDQICVEFDLYHAQIFLVDDIGRDAILTYSRGDTGAALLARSHRLPVGSKSVIGAVTASGQPVIVNDTQRSTDQHRPNDLLADTRAEMALPLLIGETIIGALDIQSTSPNVFQEQDVQVFQLLADQIAIAIYNRRLLGQSDERVRQIDDLNRQLTRGAWANIDEKLSLERAYHYDLMSVRPGAADHDDGPGLSMPIRIRGEVIGALDVAVPDASGFTEDEQAVLRAVTDRVALAIENARLFQETEINLSETATLYRLTRSINEAPNMEAILEAIVQAAAPDALAAQLFEFVDAVGDMRDHFLAVAEWRAGEGPSLKGMALRITDYLFLQTLPLTEAALVSDFARDPRIDDRFRALLAPLNPGALVVIPLSVRSTVRGGILIEYALPRRFRDRDERIFTALIDQAGVALDNRLLLRQTEEDRQKLSSVLETLPAGVLVLDAETLLPVQANRQIEALFKQPLDFQVPFTTAAYPMYRTGTEMAYTDEELPIYVAAREGRAAFSDDIVLVHEDGSKTDLLMNAAPIMDSSGSITAVVAAMENIGSLRGLENALQDNLRETIALYEVTRSLSEAHEIEEVLDTLVTHLAMTEPGDAAVILADEHDGSLRVVRTLMMPPEDFVLPSAVFESQQASFVPDVRQADNLDDKACAALEAMGIAALAAIPLRAMTRELPAGWIVLTFDTPHTFAPEDERFLTTLADSASVALDNRYLFLSTQSALQEASILFQASRALTTAVSSQDVLNAVIGYLLQPNTLQVFVAQLETPSWDSPNASAAVVAGWRADDSVIDLTGVSLTPEEFLAWRYLANPQLLIIEDINLATDASDLERAGLESLGLTSVVVMPLRMSGRQIGAIWIGMTGPFKASERDYRIYQAFAEQSSIALEAARLLAQTERRARQLETSAQVSQFASSILDLDILLPRLVDLIRKAFHYDHVQVFLMDREGEYALLRASTGEAGIQLLSIGHKLQKGSRSVIGAVTLRGEPVIALDTGSADVVHRPNPYLPHTRSEMAVPLIVKNKVAGALDVQSNQPNAFGDDDLTVLTTLAAQISVAIDNARLFEQAEHRANDMSLLFAVTTAAASAESLEDALHNVAEDLKDSLNALTVGIYLPAAFGDSLRDETYTMMKIAAVAGVSQPISELTEVKVGDSKNLIGISASNFRSFVINKVAEESLYLPLDAAAGSAVVVPLTSAAKLIGLITMESAETFAFDHETLTLLQTMGGTLSAIIQNAQLLAQVQKNNEQLRELDRIKSEFLANMSHELRTPLNSIIGFSRVILKGIDGPLTEMQEQDLTTIYNSGQHLLGLINDILDQAKIASGKMDLKFDYFDVRSVVEGVRSIGIGLVKDKPITINVEIQSGLPHVYGDEFRMRQVLLNLVSNAAKFTNEGSITLAVYTVQNPHADGHIMVRIDVADTGIGIAQKDMPLLFEAFRQIDSSLTRTVGGTGLGLPISKSLVEMQGGELTVESVVNVGSTFSLTIPTEPVNKPQSDQDQKKAVVVSEDITPTSLNDTGNGTSDTLRINTATVVPQERATQTMVPAKRQVLLIEDNPDRVDQFRRVIQREGFDVFTASIPLEAEAMASGLRPTLVIIDVNFAGGQGWNILLKLKQRDDTFDIPVIVVTLSEEKERALEAGAFAFLQHPIMPEDLLKAVKQAEQESATERILIIDDQPESTRLLKQMLDEHGQYRIFEAHNGVEGVSMVARRRPDLVILDLRMPEMDGFAVINELRSNPETVNIPILVVTGDMLDAGERDQLSNVNVMYKTDITLQDYQRFIQGVETHLSRSED